MTNQLGEQTGAPPNLIFPPTDPSWNTMNVDIWQLVAFLLATIRDVWKQWWTPPNVPQKHALSTHHHDHTGWILSSSMGKTLSSRSLCKAHKDQDWLGMTVTWICLTNMVPQSIQSPKLGHLFTTSSACFFSCHGVFCCKPERPGWGLDKPGLRLKWYVPKQI